MSTPNERSPGLVPGVIAGLIVLGIGLAFGLVPERGEGVRLAAAQAVMMPAASVAVLAASAAESAGNPAPAVQVDGEAVRFLFASGKAELAAGAPEALGVIVKGVAAGRKAVISGHQDATGNAASNEALARQRVLAVQGALEALGIGADKIELRQLELGIAGGSNAEARRVEVTLE